MPKTAEFSEKTYETYFTIELANKANDYFAPGQVDEAILGFDAAFDMPFRLLHHWLPYERHRRRRRLTGIDIREIDHLFELESSRLPSFRLNLFVQYKLPKFIETKKGTEWPSWNEPYFRYKITQHQQVALSSLEHVSRGRAKSIYAAPALLTLSELVDARRRQRIIDQSNIVGAVGLSSHKVYSYLNAGFIGKAHSDPQNFEGPSIDQILATAKEQEPLPLNRHIKDTARSIEKAISHDDLRASLVKQVTAYYLDGYDSEQRREDDPFRSFTYSLTTLQAFKEVFGLQVNCIG
jgi:hypothetical protein